SLVRTSALPIRRSSISPFPRLRGEGRDKGLFPRRRTAESPPHPKFARSLSSGGASRRPVGANFDLSPQAGRGEPSARYCTGQSSAVIVAASAPTISDNDSRPVRSSVEARSFLMFTYRLRPL